MNVKRPRDVRTLILWVHLLTGTCVGVVVLVTAATGVLLAYERQVTEWANG